MKELSPRMKASMCPSGENAGYTAESVKKVSCCQFWPATGALRDEPKNRNAPTAAASTRLAAAKYAYLLRFRPSGAGTCERCDDRPAVSCFPLDDTGNLPELVSRRNRCRSVRISAAC